MTMTIDWQPVRISPIKNEAYPHATEVWKRNVGKVIRVRPAFDYHVIGDPDLRVFEIHPDDFLTLDAVGEPFLTENQIQAD